MNHADNCTLITQYYWQLPWQHVTSVFSACSTLECRNTGVWTTSLDNPSFCHRNPCHEIRKWLISTQHVPISIYISCHLYMREVVYVQSIDMTQQEVSFKLADTFACRVPKIFICSLLFNGGNKTEDCNRCEMWNHVFSIKHLSKTYKWLQLQMPGQQVYHWKDTTKVF